MAQRVRIAAVGEVDEDLYLDELPASEGAPGGRDVGRLGGISVNFARAARWAGAEVAVYAAVGDDARGTRLRHWLEDAQLDAHVRVLPGASASQRIRVEGSGERRFCGFDPGVLAAYRLHPHELEELRDFDLIALPWSPEGAELFTQVATAPLQRARLVADFSQDSATDPDDPVGWLTPHLGPGSRLAAAFVGGRQEFVEPLRSLSRRTEATIVLTAGAHGAFALYRGEGLHQPTLARDLVDTTGCGDAFQGAFCARWCTGAPLADALQMGARCAALVAARRGAAVPR
jgi:sugar/nucleoside kinase (ribokinase family)